MDDDKNSPDVIDLIAQLQGSGALPENLSKEIEGEFILSKEDLEKFLLNNAGRLIKDSLDYIDEIGQFVKAAPDSKDVEALAKLIAASSSAIESLNKIHIANEKNKTAVGIKQLDIESKKQLQDTEIKGKLLLNREELFDKLVKNAEIVEIDEDD